MAKTFMQMADEAMAKAHQIGAEEALMELEKDSEALLVDVRDEAEVQITGLGVRALNASGRSLAWKADLAIDEEYREPELQDRSRRIITTCGSSPCYRGAKAANLLADMGFTNVSFVDGGMKALLAVAFLPAALIDIPASKQEEQMTATYSYACKDFPGMESCPAHFHAETDNELWKIIELHAQLAHGEDASQWPVEDIAQLKALIKAD